MFDLNLRKLPSQYREISVMNLNDVRFLKYFYHIWAWQPSWSCDQHFVDEFSFTCTYKLAFKIWLKMGQWFLRKAS